MTAAATDVSILVTTFERPRHLALALESIARQRASGCRLEVVVSDDGSADETAAVVSDFAARVALPVRFTSRPHDGFRLAAVRNAAARLATGRYLLFLDGDCLIPPHHVAAHLARRRPGTVLLGHCARLDAAASAALEPGKLGRLDPFRLVPRRERRALRRRRLRDAWYAAVRHPTKPRLAGGDFGVWRSDFERVNGFDERFAGWGQEDDDLGLRLRAAGARLESILGATASLHLWHPTDPTAGPRWRDGPNVAYFGRRGRLTACRRGLVARRAAEIAWGLPADLATTPLGRTIERLLDGSEVEGPGRCEVELLVRPGAGRFSRAADCRLVVAAEGAAVEPEVRSQADVVAVVDPREEAAVARLLDEVG